MRLAVNFDAPRIEEVLLGRNPSLEIVKVVDGIGPTVSADLLLATTKSESPLSNVLRRCHGLQWVHILGTGVDSFPFDDAKGLLITCSRGATAVPIAEWVLAMMLCAEKRLPGTWVTSPPPRWFVGDLGSLSGKTLGLLGFGHIGQAVAKRALAFDMRIIAKTRTARPSPMAGVEMVERLDDVLSTADHLVLALPATNATHRLLGSENLARTKPGVHLVNVARSALVDQEALRALLDNGHIRTASLDVVEPEPLPAGHWMYSHPSVRLSPHVSWVSEGMVDRILAIFIRNLDAFVQGRTLEGVVDPDAGY